MATLLAFFFGSQLGFLAANASAKPQPPPRPAVGLTFPHQNIKLGEKSSLLLHLNCPRRWKTAEITTTVTAVTEIAKKSAATDVTCPASLTATAGPDGHTTTVDLPLTVAKNGEYLIEVSVRYKAGDATAGRATNTAGVLAENGTAWLGLGTIEYAFIERTKADLDIEGTPQGAGLAKLNAILKDWDEKRQAAALKN